MLAYAPRRDRRRASPATLGVIVAGHAIAIGLLMTARMDVSTTWKPDPTKITLIPEPKPPEPVPLKPQPPRPAPNSGIDTPPVIIPMPLPGPSVEPLPMPLPNPGPIIGQSVDPLPLPTPTPIPSTGPRFRTPADSVRPPYPDSKRAMEEEATLRLRLGIDVRGRVTSVAPVGRADQVFLEAARRHILRAWRYGPATEGGKAVASSTTVTLKFELD
jgi:protein TonB